MTVKEFAEELGLKLMVSGDTEKEVTGCYCGDLLSWAMSRANEGDAWLTVMGNINAVAVAVLTDCALIILTDGATIDDAAKEKAELQGVTIFGSEKDTYSLAAEISKLI